MINDIVIPYGYFLKVYVIQKKFRYINSGGQEKMQQKCKLTSCVSNQFNGILMVRALNQDQRRKDYLPVYILIDCATSLRHHNNYHFSENPKSAFVAHLRGGEKNTKRRGKHQCHYCDKFCRYKHKYTKHIKHCSRRLGFIYWFQDDEIESDENYIKHEKNFPFAVVGDLETNTGCISELEGGSMFATSYCIMFNFHPLLEMTPVVYSRSFGQNEKELKCVTIPEDYLKYIDTDDYRCILYQCVEVLKKQKNKPSPHYA